MAPDPGMAPVSFGDVLRRHRVASGLTQEELAERAGISARGISDLERGARTRPQRETVNLLAEALGLTGAERAAFLAARQAPADGRSSTSAAGGPFPRARLPAPLDTLVGREREVSGIADLVRAGDVRLVTLTGPGGVGKTRLAIAVATALRGDFADRVAFIPLATITDPALVVPTAAERLGLREGTGRPTEQLAAALRGRRTLLVLDNLEQVVGAAPSLAELLAACPELRVLTTSRVSLRVSGEHRVLVPPLDLPDLETGAVAGRLADAPAVALFVARARAADAGFVLAEADAPAVAEICRRVDGLPLAIELAAARVSLLPPRALLDRLEPALPLLASGRRDAPTRQGTMRDAIAWSYDLLLPAEQALFRRLAVFVGGFTLDAASAVGGTANGPGIDVLDGVDSLVEASLLRRLGVDDGEVRFGMLETVREFGLEQLRERGDEVGTRTAHAAYFLAHAEIAAPHLFEADATAWTDRLERERANLGLALAWLDQSGEAEALLRLAAALGQFWELRALPTEGQAWLERALAVAGTLRSTARLDVLMFAAMLANTLGDRAREAELLQDHLRIARSLGDTERMAKALTQLGIMAEDRGDYDVAEAHLTEGTALARQAGPRYTLALTLAHLGVVAYGRGDLTLASARLEEALAFTREIGHWLPEHIALLWLGQVACDRGDFQRSAACFREVFPILHDKDLDSLARTVAGVAILSSARGEQERAARLFGAATTLRETVGLALALPERAIVERASDLARADLGVAAFSAAWAAGRALTAGEAAAEAWRVVDEPAAGPASERSPAQH